MNTQFLSEVELAQVESIMSAYGLRDFSADVRLWGRGKAIEVNGTLDQQDLSCLLAISRYLNKDRVIALADPSDLHLPSNGTAADDVLRPPAGAAQNQEGL